MEKKTFVPERKAYLAPAAKSHLIAIEENIMSGEYGPLGQSPDAGEDDYQGGF